MWVRGRQWLPIAVGRRCSRGEIERMRERWTGGRVVGAWWRSITCGTSARLICQLDGMSGYSRSKKERTGGGPRVWARDDALQVMDERERMTVALLKLLVVAWMVALPGVKI